MKEFGAGRTLRKASRWLQDDETRHARIIDVAERNSVIEGLPPLQEETRRRIMEQLETIEVSGRQQEPID